MNLPISVDRFEGDQKEVAVLLLEDGRTFNIPRDLLPRGVKAGDALTLALERDPKAGEAAARRAKSLRDDLSKTDPGGDITL